MGVGGQHHGPAALPPGKTRYPSYRRLGGPQGRSGQVLKISVNIIAKINLKENDGCSNSITAFVPCYYIMVPNVAFHN